MTSRRAFLLTAGALVLPAFATEPSPLLREVRQRLTSEPVVRGAFEQRKTVKGFRNPLVSGGEFVVSRNAACSGARRNPSPRPGDDARPRAGARRRRQRGAAPAASEEPAVRAISETLFGVMAPTWPRSTSVS